MYCTWFLYMVSALSNFTTCSLRWYGGNLLDSLMNLVASPSTDVQSPFDVVSYHVSQSIVCFSQRGTWMFPNREGNQKLRWGGPMLDEPMATMSWLEALFVCGVPCYSFGIAVYCAIVMVRRVGIDSSYDNITITVRR